MTNNVIVSGNLGSDPETRYMENGDAVTSMSIAIDERTKDRNKPPSWVKVEVWGKTAENCQLYLKKGSYCIVSGKLVVQSWVDKQTGQNRTKTFIRGFNVDFVRTESSSGAGQNNQAPQQQYQQPPQQQYRQPQQAPQQPPQQPPPQYQQPQYQQPPNGYQQQRPPQPPAQEQLQPRPNNAPVEPSYDDIPF